jgi:plastocyanin
MINTYYPRVANSLVTRAMHALVLGALFLVSESFAGVMPAALSIDINKFAFEPKEVTVAPGTKIIWTNDDESPHTVTSQDKTFGSKALDTDDKFEYTFNSVGDFYYYCTVHPFMTAVVHVRNQ